MLPTYGIDTRTLTAEEIKNNGIGLKRDCNLKIKNVQIGAPEVWEHIIENPGGHTIDLTEFTGRVEYKSRKLIIDADRSESYDKHAIQGGRMLELMHGKKFHILLGNDETHYYTGRCKLSFNKDNSIITGHSMEIQCEPYRHILPPISLRFKDYETGAANELDAPYISMHIGERSSAADISFTKINPTGKVTLTVQKQGVGMDIQTLNGEPYVFKYTGDILFAISNASKFTLSIDNKEL